MQKISQRPLNNFTQIQDRTTQNENRNSTKTENTFQGNRHEEKRTHEKIDTSANIENPWKTLFALNDERNAPHTFCNMNQPTSKNPKWPPSQDPKYSPLEQFSLKRVWRSLGHLRKRELNSSEKFNLDGKEQRKSYDGGSYMWLALAKFGTYTPTSVQMGHAV